MSEIDRLAGIDQQIVAKHKVFARGSAGPFLCATCEHWLNDLNACDSEKLIKAKEDGLVPLLRLERRRGRQVLLFTYADDCCDFHEKA